MWPVDCHNQMGTAASDVDFRYLTPHDSRAIADCGTFPHVVAAVSLPAMTPGWTPGLK